MRLRSSSNCEEMTAIFLRRSLFMAFSGDAVG
jgi:hypothetical protein